jgi:peroxygenase
MEPQEEVQTELPEVPVMRDRPPAIGLDKQLASPALPRANEAADLQHPHGTTGHPKGRSVLQQHVDFFDE